MLLKIVLNVLVKQFLEGWLLFLNNFSRSSCFIDGFLPVQCLPHHWKLRKTLPSVQLLPHYSFLSALLTSSFCNNYNVPTLPWRQSQPHFFLSYFIDHLLLFTITCLTAWKWASLLPLPNLTLAGPASPRLGEHQLDKSIHCQNFVLIRGHHKSRHYHKINSWPPPTKNKAKSALSVINHHTTTWAWSIHVLLQWRMANDIPLRGRGISNEIITSVVCKTLGNYIQCASKCCH